MTTDLRAALRDNRDTLAWLLADQHEQQHDEIDADDNHREKRQRAVDALTRLVALADAPPTVAELLPMVDAGHEVRWIGVDGDQWRAVTYGRARVLAFFWLLDGDWHTSDIKPADLNRPATLEVTP